MTRADPTQIFSWLICRSWDDNGNARVYEYVPENSQGVNRAQAKEANRTNAVRGTQRYLSGVVCVGGIAVKSARRQGWARFCATDDIIIEFSRRRTRWRIPRR